MTEPSDSNRQGEPPEQQGQSNTEGGPDSNALRRYYCHVCAMYVYLRDVDNHMCSTCHDHFVELSEPPMYSPHRIQPSMPRIDPRYRHHLHHHITMPTAHMMHMPAAATVYSPAPAFLPSVLQPGLSYLQHSLAGLPPLHPDALHPDALHPGTHFMHIPALMPAHIGALAMGPHYHPFDGAFTIAMPTADITTADMARLGLRAAAGISGHNLQRTGAFDLDLGRHGRPAHFATTPGYAIHIQTDMPFNELPNMIPNTDMFGNMMPDGLANAVQQLIDHLAGGGPPPASTEAIQSLQDYIITASDVEDQRECSVCMDAFTVSEETKRLPCNHIFHERCILPWLEIRGTCPVCRRTLDGQDTSRNEFVFTGGVTTNATTASATTATGPASRHAPHPAPSGAALSAAGASNTVEGDSQHNQDPNRTNGSAPGHVEPMSASAPMRNGRSGRRIGRASAVRATAASSTVPRSPAPMAPRTFLTDLYSHLSSHINDALSSQMQAQAGSSEANPAITDMFQIFEVGDPFSQMLLESLPAEDALAGEEQEEIMASMVAMADMVAMSDNGESTNLPTPQTETGHWNGIDNPPGAEQRDPSVQQDELD